VRHLSRAKDNKITQLDREIAIENKWRAQRYGTACFMVSRDGPVRLSEYLPELTLRLADDAAALGCESEVEHCKLIVHRGSSADTQLRIENEGGGSNAVKRWLVQETLA
jgi:carboxylate-amine ligase